MSKIIRIVNYRTRAQRNARARRMSAIWNGEASQFPGFTNKNRSFSTNGRGA